MDAAPPALLTFIRTPIERLRHLAALEPRRLAFGYVRGGETLTDELTYADLRRQADIVAAALLQQALPGDRILLPLKPGPAFPAALFGCWRAGMVPVPAYPPRANRANDRALVIARDAGAGLALIHDEPQGGSRQALEAGAVPCLDLGELDENAPEPPWFDWPDDTPHLLQYTSGSTSDPKGVAISAAALAANLDAINNQLHPVEDSVTVSWLPHFHDFGLIEAHIQTIWRGGRSYLISPTEFVKDPVVWLRTMSRFRATETEAPNFAYDLLVRTLWPENVSQLDLSSLRNVIIGAEPIRKATADAFLALTQPIGLRSDALSHGYGMAETTLGASGHPGPAPFIRLNADALERGQALPAGENEPGHDVASCGFPLQGFEMVIVDPANGQRLSANRVGEVWFAGPSIALGYWQKPDATAAAFGARTADGAGPFLRTGDIGFADADGRLYITGRLKELIIVRGKNHYPQDIEATARAAAPHLSAGRAAAFAVDDQDRECVVLVQEVRRDAAFQPDAAIAAVRRAVADEHGLELHAIALIRLGTMPVTSSGKVQRWAARQAWRGGGLAVVHSWRHSGEPATIEDPDDTFPPALPSENNLIRQLTRFAADLAGLAPEQIDPAEPLSHLGLGSIEATRLLGLIETNLGLSIDPTAPYTHPTIGQLARLIQERSREPAAQAVATALSVLPTAAVIHSSSPEEALPSEGIAIVGMACRFPGAPDIESYWRLIRDGRSAIGPVPAGRTDLAATFAALPPDVPRRGGFLNHVDGFDPGFFQMAPAEAALLDPQHRLFLEVAWEALEGLADAPDHWAGRRVGVFVGVSQIDYAIFLAAARRLSNGHTLTGNAHNMAANRLSYLLDLKGPSLAIDTACSSSLVALATAKRTIEAGDCDMAIVGGTNLILDGRVTEAFHRAGMLSPDGACKSFGAAADGYGRGEGCGVVILKRVAEARAAGDRIWALVPGVAINQDGLSNGLTAPNGQAQEEVIKSARISAGGDGAAIAYVEAHGTGTPLGDPVEANAIAAALGSSAVRPRIGTVKANIGHLEAAAGIAGLIKAVLVLDRRTAPPIAGLAAPNPLIAAASVHFDLTSEAAPLPPGTLCAGVSSFGFGGTNAHVILRSVAADQGVETAPPAGPAALCLSARDDAGLRAVASAWRDALRGEPDRPASVFAANALRRRAALRRRLVVTGADAGELADRLDSWLDGDVQRFGDEDGPELVMARSWLDGGRPDWRLIWGDNRLPLLPLPTYPFQRQRCWATASPVAPILNAESTTVSAKDTPAAFATGDIEQRLSAVIGRLLGLDPATLDRSEKFIEMGADSIILASALREVEQSFGVTIDFRQILEKTPSVATLAAYLASRTVPPAQSEAQTEAGAGAPPAAFRLGASATTDAAINATLAETERTLGTLLAQQRHLRTLVALRENPTTGIAIPSGLVGRHDAPVTSDRTDRTRPLPEEASTSLAALSARYLPRTAGSKRLAAAARDGLADVRAAAGFRGSIKEMLYPIAAERASGARMTDIDGNEYIDLAMGFGVLLFGHAPDFVAQALTGELARGMPLGPQNRLAGEVAGMLRQLTGTERAAFTTTGTEAVMTALRLARAVTGRRKVVIFEGAYHGHSDGTLGIGRETDGRLETLPLAPGVAEGAIADLIVLPYATDRSLEIVRALGDRIAAVLVEPVQSRRPDLQPRDFQRALRDICDQSGSALVFDEMITGFRIAPGGAAAHFGVLPDLVTYGKILGGGMPIGAIAGARRFLDALDGGTWRYGDESGPRVPTTFFAGTFNKHPLAMAGAHAVLRHLIAEGPSLQEQLNLRAAELEARLTSALRRAGLGLARFGSMFRFTHGGNADPFFYGLLDRGIYLWEGRTCFLSTAHGAAELDQIVDAVEATVAEIAPASPVLAVKTCPVPARCLSPGSAQLLRLADLMPGSWLAYQEAAAIRLPVGTTAAEVERAIGQLAERHPALRLVIESGGEFTSLPPLVTHRLSGRPSGPNRDLTDLLARERAVPLDRTQPLWRAVLVEMDAAPILMLVVHHIVIDGISLGLLLGEAARLITGVALAVPPATPSAGIEPSRQAARAGNAAWWRERLAALPPTPELPADRPRPAVARFAGGSVERTLCSRLLAAVQRSATATAATPFMVMVAAWTATLHRISGSERLTLGITVAGRETEAEAAMIGNFAQMLPIESRLGRQDSLEAHFRTVRAALLDSYTRQDVDMAGALEAAARPFDPARPTLFPLAFNLDQMPSAEVVSVSTTHSKFELALNVMRGDDAVIARLDFAADLFDHVTAVAWLDGFIAVLEALCTTPERRPAEVWAAPTLAAATTPPPYQTLPDWLAASAAVRPDSVAVSCEGAQLTYRALAARAGAVARAVADRVPNEKPKGEHRVAVILRPSLDLPAALWGVHVAGYAYLPLDARHPPARLRQILADTGTALILTDEFHRPALESLGVPLLVVEQVPDGPPPPWPALSPERLAYLLHSSGSTGEPRGIGVTQAGLVNLLASMADIPGAGPSDRLLALTPLTFDIAALELFLPLVTGGTLVIAPTAIRGDGRALARHAADIRPTIMQATPSVWTLLIEAGWRPEPGMKALAGGEALPAPLAARLIAGGAEVWNMYGPTETTIWSSRGRVTTGSAIDLGQSVRGTTLSVLDPALDPVPPGSIGELAIGGAGLSRGYWNRPDLTAERFLPAPNGGRLYRTGDLVRLDASGRLYFLGRRDHQVKIAGHRIELDEVAGALEALPDVARAVAFVEGTGARAHLAACVLPAGDARLAAGDLRTQLEGSLPAYLVPAHLHVVTSLPTSANGKIDRRALSTLEIVEAPPSAPASSLEARIAAIWRTVLGVDQIDPSVSFFAQGGTSLGLAYMHVGVVREIGRDFPLYECVQFPTVRALARHLEPPAKVGPARPLDHLAPAAARGRARSEQLRRLSGVGGGHHAGAD
jgi:iturin family lipopeptide synthetase A